MAARMFICEMKMKNDYRHALSRVFSIKSRIAGIKDFLKFIGRIGNSDFVYILDNFKVVRPDDQSTFLACPSEFIVVSGDRTTANQRPWSCQCSES